MRHPISKTVLGCAAAFALCACAAPEPQTPTQESPTSATQAQPRAPALKDPVQAKRSPGQENEPLLAYRAFGTEPFWSVRVDGDTLVFSTPEDQAGQTMRGTHATPAGGVRYTGQHAGKAFQLDILPGDCSDGMSDNRYVFTATFRYGETTYKGCAERAMAK